MTVAIIDDDIEDRAAELMARMAARRAQMGAPAQGAAADAAPPPAAEESATPAPTDVAADVPDDLPAAAPAEVDDAAADPQAENPGRHRAGRRMAPPPWQTGSVPVGHTASAAPSLWPEPPSGMAQPSASPLPPPLVPPPPWDPTEWLPAPPPAWPAGPATTTPVHDSPAGAAAHTQALHVPPSLDEAEVLSRDQDVPRVGWRRAVHRMSLGHVNPGLSRKERERRLLFDQIRHPIIGDFRIAVLSIKGGVGKTTTTLGLGSALAMVRTDRVIAVDANPDRGTLAERVQDTSTSSTVRDLLRDPHIRRYAEVRNHTRMSTSRLEVLASEQDPAVAEVFGETDYRRTIDILRNYYNVILTDCGTGIMHSAMAGVLDLAHAIVLVSAPAIDAARSAAATLDWLTQHGYGTLVREAHVVFSASQPRSNTLKLDKVIEHFEARCGSIHVIPYERHLAEGADFEFGLLRPVTTQAYLELAGAVSQKFSRSEATSMAG